MRIRIVAACAVAFLLHFAPSASAMRYVRSPYPGGSATLENAVEAVFPARMHRAALNVGWCESRGNPRAKNGQYRGLFQIGKGEWADYGQGDIHNPIDNAAAAYRYYNAVGSWRPWQCQP